MVLFPQTKSNWDPQYYTQNRYEPRALCLGQRGRVACVPPLLMTSPNRGTAMGAWDTLGRAGLQEKRAKRQRKKGPKIQGRQLRGMKKRHLKMNSGLHILASYLKKCSERPRLCRTESHQTDPLTKAPSQAPPPQTAAPPVRQVWRLALSVHQREELPALRLIESYFRLTGLISLALGQQPVSAAQPDRRLGTALGRPVIHFEPLRTTTNHYDYTPELTAVAASTPESQTPC